MDNEMQIDEMKCPYCHSENINLVCNTSDVWWTGVNESEGEYRYECEECEKKFRIYEKTKAVERRITKEEEE